MKKRAVIFDRDGVLVNSALIHINSVVRTFRELGIEINDDDKMYVVSRHPTDYINYFLDKYDFDREEFLEKQSINYIKIFRDTPLELFNETIKVVNILKSEGFLIGMTTSSDVETTEIFIEKSGLHNVFDAIVTAEECEEKKPNPLPYLLTAKKLNIDTDDCIVIEDSQTGVLAAKNAMMECFAIPNEYTKKHNFVNADKVLDDPNSIIKLLNEAN